MLLEPNLGHHQASQSKHCDPFRKPENKHLLVFSHRLYCTLVRNSIEHVHMVSHTVALSKIYKNIWEELTIYLREPRHVRRHIKVTSRYASHFCDLSMYLCVHIYIYIYTYYVYGTLWPQTRMKMEDFSGAVLLYWYRVVNCHVSMVVFEMKQ